MALNLTILNQTQNVRLYLAGGVSLPAGGSYSAVSLNVFQLSRDSSLTFDCKAGNVTITDGVNIYQGNDAINYLDLIATSLGGAVVGYMGAPAPNFQITTGGKDPSGNSQPQRMNQFTDSAVNFRNSYANLTGNSTTTVKSGSGTLHGFLINDNTTGGTATVYDSASASGAVIAVIQFGSQTLGNVSPNFMGPLGLEFQNGLTVVMAGSGSNNMTILYQ